MTRAKRRPFFAIAKPMSRPSSTSLLKTESSENFPRFTSNTLPPGWQDKTVLQLPNYVGHPLINVFKKISAANVADFCLEMYRGMGLLEGIRVVRSSDPAVRRAACDVLEYFVDVPYEGETVRARFTEGALTLHEGGDSFVTLPATTPFPRNKSVPRAIPGSAGCNPSCTARITLPGLVKKPTFTRKRHRKSLLSIAMPLNVPMKRTPKSHPEPASLLAFGAHPDDIEFGCGGVIAKETRGGRKAHFVICSRGEAGTHGTQVQRVAEAKKSAALLGATIEFIELDGDAHLEVRVAHAIKLAGILRRVRPGIVLAPSLVENQHPDHAKLGQLVRDAARLARYGGLKELQRVRPHAIEQLFFYAVTPEAEPPGITPVFMDVSVTGNHGRLDRGDGSAYLTNLRPRLR